MTTSPNMNLPIPTIGTDTGLQWEQYVQAALNIIDGHTHASGSGVPVLPAGININADLAFNDHNGTLFRSVRFQVQPAALSQPADLGCLYVSGADLYFNDENGTQIQITSGGSVAVTSSGISSGNASAAFISTVLVVYSDTPTTVPGNISVGSLLLGLNTSSANRLTLSPPASLSGGSYSLALPAIPGATSFVTLDNSGNFGASVPIAGGIGTSNIAAGAVTSAKIAAATVQDSNLAVLKTVFSSVVSFSTNNTAYQVSGLTASITTAGGAVLVGFTGNALRYSTGGTTAFADTAVYGIFRDGVLVGEQVLSTTVNAIQVPPGTLTFIDGGVPAGAHTYAVKVKVTNGTGGSIGGGFVNTLMQLTEL